MDILDGTGNQDAHDREINKLKKKEELRHQLQKSKLNRENGKDDEKHAEHKAM